MILVATLVAIVAAVARGPFMLAEHSWRASSNARDEGNGSKTAGGYLLYAVIERSARLGSAGVIAWELTGDQWLLGGFIFGIIAFWLMPMISAVVAARFWRAASSDDAF